MSAAALLKSCQCTQAQLETEAFEFWAHRLGEEFRPHRKVWEYCYVAQALHERNMLGLGRRGLGFAVGQEPNPSVFASYGCEIVATDLATDQARQRGWVDTNQHAASLEVLNRRGLCPRHLFGRKVSFRFLDMRQIPGDLGRFDFIWSSCSLEHLGSLELGERFIYESLRLVKPGGVAVHTTEYNVTSNGRTIEEGETVLFRRKDLERIVARLREQGHEIEIDFADGNRPADRAVDQPPYTHNRHIKLQFGEYVITSFGLIIRKSAR